jgi:hypothetical protein
MRGKLHLLQKVNFSYYLKCYLLFFINPVRGHQEEIEK